jgi:diguanylate cyclase (GGDEF)-like protein
MAGTQDAPSATHAQNRLRRVVDSSWLLAASAYIAFVLGSHIGLHPDSDTDVLAFAAAFAFAAAIPMSFTRGHYLVVVDLTDAVVLTSLFFVDRFDLLLAILLGFLLSQPRARRRGIGDRVSALTDLVVTFAPAGLLFSLPIGHVNSASITELVALGAMIAIPNLLFHVLHAHSISRVAAMRLFNSLINISIAMIAVTLLKTQPLTLPALGVIVGAFILATRGMRRTSYYRNRLEWLVGWSNKLDETPNDDLENYLVDSLTDFFPQIKFEVADYEPSGGARYKTFALGTNSKGPRWLLAEDIQGKGALKLLTETESFIASACSFLKSHNTVEASKEQLRSATLHDPLTGLPSRRLLDELINQSIVTARRNHAHVAVVAFNCDRFKEINETHGHEIGDYFLIEVASRVRYVLRSNDVLARLGGDDFVFLLSSVRNKSDVEHVILKVLDALEAPIDIADGIRAWISSGVALFPENGETAKELLHSASEAMNEAKTTQNGWVFASNAQSHRFAPENVPVEWQHVPDPTRK